MALSNATLLNGATNSATGGTTMNFSPSGKDVPNGVEIVDVGATDFVTRTTISFKAKMPTYNATTNTWSKGSREVTLVKPKVLSDGTVSFPVVRIKVETHPEMSAAEETELRSEAAQLLFDSDFWLFWQTGSKA